MPLNHPLSTAWTAFLGETDEVLGIVGPPPPYHIRIFISVHSIALLRTLTGDQYHPIYSWHQTLHALSVDILRSNAQDAPWMCPWLIGVGCLPITFHECPHEGNGSWRAWSLWDQLKPSNEWRTVISSLMPYSSHSILELIISFNLAVRSWDRRPAWASRSAGVAVHLWNRRSVLTYSKYNDEQ